MNRRRTATIVAALALLAGGCADTLSSMTEHWFYGYVRSAEAGELCLADARTEDARAERCFTDDGGQAGQVGQDDLVKVRYEPEEGEGHGGGRVLELVPVRKAGSTAR